MKILFIKAQNKIQNKNSENIEISKNELKNLPKEIFLVYSIQYKGLAEQIKEQLESIKTKVTGFSQVLGCSKLRTKNKEPILLVGSGRFHALNLAVQGNIVYVLEGNTINKLPDKEIEKIKIKRKTALLKFLSSKNIGILVSTKPGQQNIKQALILKQKLEKKGKKAHIFIDNNINLNEFENFPDIEFWVNTSCPGIILDSENSNILNSNEIENKEEKI